MSIKKIKLVFYIIISIIYANLFAESPVTKKTAFDENIHKECKAALDFYLERPDLEAEFLRRLNYCKQTARDISPKGYKTNLIISDFKSMYGVNGRTRMQIHQGIDIIGQANDQIIAIADGKVLETTVANCVGPSLIIDHGQSTDNKKLITIYTHIGEILVKEGEKIKRGSPIAKLPVKIEFPCMARVRHLHLQIGQEYCEKEDKGKWGCQFFIKDLYNSLNPHDYWSDGANNMTCFEKNKKYMMGTITYPFVCEKD